MIRINIKQLLLTTLAFIYISLLGCTSYSPPKPDNTTAQINFYPNKKHNMTIAHICNEDGYLSLIGRVYESPEANLDYLFKGNKNLSTIVPAKKPVVLAVGTKGCHNFISFQPVAGETYDVFLLTSNSNSSLKPNCNTRVYLHADTKAGSRVPNNIVTINEQKDCRKI